MSHFMALGWYCFFSFSKWKVSGNPVLNKSVSGIFLPVAFTHFVRLCRIQVILKIFHTFSLLYLLYLQSEILDITIAERLWCTIGSDDGKDFFFFFCNLEHNALYFAYEHGGSKLKLLLES